MYIYIYIDTAAQPISPTHTQIHTHSNIRSHPQGKGGGLKGETDRYKYHFFLVHTQLDIDA